MNSKYLIFNIIVILLIFSSCNKSKNDKIQIIKINVSAAKKYSFHNLFSKIEIIPLQTSDSILVDKMRYSSFTKDFIVLSDKKSIVWFFDKNGKFISSSLERLGQGPKDYGIIMGVSYNQFTKNIDILTPNYIIKYDKLFLYVGKSKLPFENKKSQKQEGTYFKYLFPIDKNKYVLLPTTVSHNPHQILFYDSNDENIINEFSYDDLVLSNLTQQVNNICYYNDSILAFSPLAFSYSNFTININTLKVKEEFRFNFGNSQIEERELSNYNSEREKSNFLAFNSNKPIPLRTFFNEKYIISHIKHEKKYLTYFKIKNTSEEMLINNQLLDENNRLPIFESLIDNVLYAILNPNEIDKYITKEMLNYEGMMVLKKINPDNNPVIVKYFLK